MTQLISSDKIERTLRTCLAKEGFELSRPRSIGETGTDLIAIKNKKSHFIEIIGFKKYPPARSKDFYEIFFRAVSRLKDGAKSIVIALPERFGDGLHQRASQYGKAWKRIGDAFPELEIWLVNDDTLGYRRTKWNSWFT